MKKHFLIGTALAAVLCASHPAAAGMDYFKSTEEATSPIDTSSDETAAKSQAAADDDQPLLKPKPKAEAPVAAAPESDAPIDTAAPANANANANAHKDYKPYLTSQSPQKTSDTAPAAAATASSGAAALVSKKPTLSNDTLPPLLPRQQMRAVPTAPVPPPVAMPANPEPPVAAAPAPALAPVPTAPVALPEKPMAERGMTAPVDTNSMPVMPPASQAATPPVAPAQPAPDAAAPAVPSLADLSLSFDGDSSDISADNQRKLANLVPHLKEMQDGHLQVRGFASGKGDHSAAKRVALSRVLAVRSYFLDKGVPAKVIDVKVKGADDDGKNADRVDLLFENNP